MPNPFGTTFESLENPTSPVVDSVHADAYRQLCKIADSGEGQLISLRAPRAGYGKTMLLSRLREKKKGEMTIVPIHLLDGRRVEGESVLEEVLTQLTEALPGGSGLTKLDLHTRKLFAHGLLPLVYSGEVPSQDKDGALDSLRERPTEAFDFHNKSAAIAQWTSSQFDVLSPRLTTVLSKASGASSRDTSYWIGLLFNYAVRTPNELSRTGDLLETVFGPSSRFRSGAGFLDGLGSFLNLVTLVEPAILVLDEVDGLSSDSDSALRTTSTLISLWESAPRTSVIVSVNDDVWESAFAPRLPLGLRDRLENIVIRLKPLTSEEAKSLVTIRSGDEAERVLSHLDFESGDLYPRAVLRDARDAWDQPADDEVKEPSAKSAKTLTTTESKEDKISEFSAPPVCSAVTEASVPAEVEESEKGKPSVVEASPKPEPVVEAKPVAEPEPVAPAAVAVSNPFQTATPSPFGVASTPPKEESVAVSPAEVKPPAFPESPAVAPSSPFGVASTPPKEESAAVTPAEVKPPAFPESPAAAPSSPFGVASPPPKEESVTVTPAEVKPPAFPESPAAAASSPFEVASTPLKEEPVAVTPAEVKPPVFSESPAAAASSPFEVASTPLKEEPVAVTPAEVKPPVFSESPAAAASSPFGVASTPPKEESAAVSPAEVKPPAFPESPAAAPSSPFEVASPPSEAAKPSAFSAPQAKETSSPFQTATPAAIASPFQFSEQEDSKTEGGLPPVRRSQPAPVAPSSPFEAARPPESIPEISPPDSPFVVSGKESERRANRTYPSKSPFDATKASPHTMELDPEPEVLQAKPVPVSPVHQSQPTATPPSPFEVNKPAQSVPQQPELPKGDTDAIDELLRQFREHRNS